MAITRERKEQFVAQYTELLGESDGFAVLHATGISVAQTQDLRGKVREAGGQYVIAKNTLMRKALEQNEWTIPEELLSGPTAIVFGRENFPGVAKAVIDFIKDEKLEEKIQVTGGVMSGDILDSSSVTAISDLPTLPEIRAQLAGLVVSSASGIAGVLQAANSQIVNVLHSYVEENGEGDAA